MSSNPYTFFESDAPTGPPASTSDGPRVVLSGTLPVSDVLHAQRLAARALRWYIILGIVLGIALLMFLLDAGGREPMLLTSGVILVMSMAVPLVLAVNWVRRYTSYVRQSRQQVGIFAPSETVVSGAGFSTATVHAESRVKWSLFQGFRRSDRVVVLYLQFPSQYLVISRSKLEDPSQWPLLLELIGAALPEL